jgi:hypothetical protein
MPKLQALAVNKSTRLPGGGYAGGDSPEEHQEDLAEVSAYAWPLRAPNFR